MMSAAATFNGSSNSGDVRSSSSDDTLWRIEDLPVGLLSDPLEYFFADHHRQRQAAHIILMIADGQFSERGVKALIDFLETDFTRHVADEEISFFPLLRQNCLPEDGMDALLDKLVEDHKDDETAGAEAVELLKARLGGRRLKEEECEALRTFAEHIKSHLALENAALLPIARLRMDPHALGLLSNSLQERRKAEAALKRGLLKD